MQFPFLSVIVFIPMVAALVLLMMKPEQKKAIRVTALTAALLALALSVWVYFAYDKAAAGYQFIEKYTWMPIDGDQPALWRGRAERSTCAVDRYRYGYGRDDFLGN